MEELQLKCAVVDDSRLQRLAIVKLIDEHPSLELVAEWNNAIETKNGLLDTPVDLLFLDIEMPILTGFDLLDDLENKPHIIFVTGKTKYAFKAFDYDAVDYLRKPLKKDRFNAAVEKAMSMMRLNAEGVPVEDDDYIFVKSNLKKRKVYLKQLKYVEALGDYVKLIMEDGDPIVVLATMKSFEAELPSDRFLRIHKSYIINLDKVERYNSRNIEIADEKIPLSRHKKHSLIEALNG
ncbi:LytR/AlgR family response regulator transcription factor [Aquimarina brevivitae]|uniref:LytTR family two component transcriptional regulator n=1 Tax=Aquimarina brevivitae TaxID=323412 RepID=A0A4V2F4W2_9FLAO|nr:LytTR family DNA-binding domain-containing protein [Aquimarina brevivitae]RZS90709.1 LytTR family two component transcriptional regulator [Aquimarina brevivitae]